MPLLSPKVYVHPITMGFAHADPDNDLYWGPSAVYQYTKVGMDGYWIGEVYGSFPLTYLDNSVTIQLKMTTRIIANEGDPTINVVFL